MEPRAKSPDLPPSATFLTTDEAAAVVALSRRTLEGLRVRGGGPVYRRHAGRVVYCLADLIAWSEQSRRRSTSDTESHVAAS